jgi:mRNA interferase YafQ
MGRGGASKSSKSKKASRAALLEFRRAKRFQIDVALARQTDRFKEASKEIWALLELLRTKQPIPAKYRAHKMVGEWKDWWDCHLSGDFVLIWRYEKETGKDGKEHEYVMLAAVGSHAYLKIA